MKTAAFPQQSILEENLKYFWFFAGAAVFVETLTFILQYAEGISFTFDLYNTLTSLSLVFIPMVAVNSVYLFKRACLRYCKTDAQVLALKLAAMYLGIVLATITFEGVFHYFGFEDDDYIVMGFVEFSPSTSEVISNIFFATIVGVPIFLKQQVKMNADKALALKGEQLEKVKHLNTKAQLEALQTKVNPHFLYNSLNSIASLVHDNPDQAEEMILSLSELFRYTLSHNEGQLSTVKREIEMVKTYMAIELIRFQDRLTFHAHIDDCSETVQIPRFLLQPLVENAIKHGTSKVKEGRIQVQITGIADIVEITIEDNGPQFSDLFSYGYGLKSVTEQLEILYPGRHVFEIMNAPQKQIRIRIPNTEIPIS